MFKIGDFSRLSFVTVKTLRYYDEIGLLKPARIDRFTGYRYYSANQILRLHSIIALKNLGLSLEEIATLLGNELTAKQMRDIFIFKKAELQQNIAGDKTKLEQVEKLLKQIEKEGKMPDYQILIKKVAPQTVASIRAILPSYGDIGPLYGEIFGYLGNHGIKVPAGPTFFICYDGEFKEKDVDVEVGVPIASAIPDSGRIKVYELPGMEEAACVIYKGPYENIGETYNAIMAWVQSNGYRITGPDRELYLKSPANTQNPKEYVTEIQFPVEKV